MPGVGGTCQRMVLHFLPFVQVGGHWKTADFETDAGEVIQIARDLNMKNGRNIGISDWS